jgi:NMT1 family protein
MIRLLTIAVVSMALTSCESAPKELVLARPDGTIDGEIATSLVDLLDDTATVRVTLSEEAMTGGEALHAVAAGTADIALISNDQPFRDDIATVMPLYATVLHIVHPAGVSSPDFSGLLRNAAVFAGQEGAAARRVFSRLTSNIDLAGEDYRFITDTTLNADLAVVFAPISPERLAEYPGVQLWSIGTPGDIGTGGAIDSIVLLNPHFRPFVIPAGVYGDANLEPVVSIAVDKLIVTREDLDSAVVYDLINEVLRLRPALGSVHPGLFQQVTEDFDASRSRYILHSGAQDYLQRSEPTFVERYSGVAEVLVTLMIAMISTTLAGVRIFNRRRKNRIDRFYAAALEIRNSISTSADDAERRAARDALLQLQDDAFALLVDEKLAADESFRIFISLCEDVSRRLSSDIDQSA